MKNIEISLTPAQADFIETALNEYVGKLLTRAGSGQHSVCEDAGTARRDWERVPNGDSDGTEITERGIPGDGVPCRFVSGSTQPK